MTTTATGNARKVSGTEAVLSAATALHRAQAAEALREALGTLIDSREPFTADDVRRLAGDPDAHHPNVLPALFAGAARAGHIRQVGPAFRATRRSRNGGLCRRWQAVYPPELPGGDTRGGAA